MHIRVAEASDLNAIVACEDLAFKLSEMRPDTRNLQLATELNAQIENGTIHAITDASRLLGYVSFMRNFDHLFVSAVAVLPEQHRKGLGSQLLAYAEASACHQGLDSVRLVCDGSIPSVLSFYRHCGYTETGRCTEGTFSRVFYSKAMPPAAANRTHVYNRAS